MSGRTETRPPHPATVAQKKEAPAKKAKPPHPATAQRKEAPAKKARGPHPATVAQKKEAPARKTKAPHPASVAQNKESPGAGKAKPPHPATGVQPTAALAKKVAEQAAVAGLDEAGGARDQEILALLNQFLDRVRAVEARHEAQGRQPGKKTKR